MSQKQITICDKCEEEANEDKSGWLRFNSGSILLISTHSYQTEHLDLEIKDFCSLSCLTKFIQKVISIEVYDKYHMTVNTSVNIDN